MSRPTRFGLAALVLLVLAGGYGAYWLIVANLIENEIVGWAHAAHDRKLDASWQKIGVAGFPGGFRVDLHNAALRDGTVSPAPELHIPVLSGVASPWDLADWRFALSEGLQAELAGAGGRPPLKFAADTASGALSIKPLGAATLWLNLRQASAEAGDRVGVAAARSWIILPPTTPQSHIDPNLAVAVDLRDVQLPPPARALSDSIEELAFGLTLKVPVPSGNLVQSITAWRDAGGTIELDNLQLKWGGLGATGTGTLALDRDLQPVGGFSGAIEGYDRILRALVRAGHLRAGDAGLAQLALTMLAKSGPDGRPQIATSFTIQNGQMFLGPARLGPVPRIAWE